MATRLNTTFEKKFKPQFKNEDREPLDVTEVPLEKVNDRTLWTLIDPMLDSGATFWVPGFHYVNRVGYIFTEVPWTADDLNDEYRSF